MLISFFARVQYSITTWLMIDPSYPKHGSFVGYVDLDGAPDG